MTILTVGSESFDIDENEPYYNNLFRFLRDNDIPVESYYSEDSWTWFPKEWKVWLKLKERLESGSGYTYLEDPIFYSSFKTLHDNMLDLPEGWQSYVVDDVSTFQIERLGWYHEAGKNREVSVSYEENGSILDFSDMFRALSKYILDNEVGGLETEKNGIKGMIIRDDQFPYSFSDKNMWEDLMVLASVFRYKCPNIDFYINSILLMLGWFGYEPNEKICSMDRMIGQAKLSLTHSFEHHAFPIIIPNVLLYDSVHQKISSSSCTDISNYRYHLHAQILNAFGEAVKRIHGSRFLRRIRLGAWKLYSVEIVMFVMGTERIEHYIAAQDRRDVPRLRRHVAELSTEGYVPDHRPVTTFYDFLKFAGGTARPKTQ